MTPRTVAFLFVGVASGLLAALATMLQLGDAPAPYVLGACLGFEVGSACRGIDLAYYLFPGLAFGVLFAAALLISRRIDMARGAILAIAACVANAVAVFVCVTVFTLLARLFDPNLLDGPLAFAGVVAGAVGGGLLGAVVARLLPGGSMRWPIVAAAALGVLTPAMPELETLGVFLFFVAWQGGYAATLAASLPARD